ncbi:MAG: enoyl-CoA hydratase-related protein [Candidatus Andeanibacterium colombiense]|uniref:Enoyl-CoA hydratase-related protein n=1 Tax=Candidatus Andeanibacterium colombiense TaxID=3121345 RepID=A0AAJ5X9H6_9SPHN|nr:MAG: enoyl-CoA hydratase-related protein [Sphingomonadaceae bacterium]
MEYRSIKFDIAREIATITLARPAKLNALTPDMADEIRHALSSTEDARSVLIRSEGRAFCSGADLTSIMAGGDPGEGAYLSLERHYHPLLLDIAEHRLPVVAEVNGAAAGIGCSLALACDFCIAGEGAYFLLAFVNIGLVPDGGASWILPRLIGRARAAEMLMLGEKVHGPQAQQWGLIHRCVPENMLEHSAHAIARKLARGPTGALALMKRNLFDAAAHSYGATMAQEAEAQRLIAATEDAEEGITAFLTRREPKFKGR